MSSILLSVLASIPVGEGLSVGQQTEDDVPAPATKTVNLGAINHCALASLILSVAFVILGPFGSIPGIVCGRIALREYKNAGVSEGRGMAKAGIVIGWIGLALFVMAMFIGWIWMKRLDQVFEAIQRLNSK